MDTESAARRAGVLDLHGLAQGLHPKRVDYLGDARDHMQPVPDLLPEEGAVRAALTDHLGQALSDPQQDIAAPFVATGVRPRVAVLREQGVNGQVEMAAAFDRAGFAAVDVHMTDLRAGRVDLADFKGLAACGGFSYGDVLGQVGAVPCPDPRRGGAPTRPWRAAWWPSPTWTTGRPTERYPQNPNGSPEGITALTSVDGRATIMMPHPQRVFLTRQLSWHPADWGEASPWLRLFRNARAWVG